MNTLDGSRYIGAGPEDKWKGQIDEVRIYNRALSAREVSESYRQKAPSMAQGGTVSDNSAYTALTVQQSGAGDILNILDGSTEVFTILDGGNVGIGTETPAYKLDISGTTRTQELISDNLVLAGDNILTGYEGFNNYINTNGGIGTGGALRINKEGDLVNIGSIQAGEMLLTNGGTFAAKVDYIAGSGPCSVSMGDVSGDGKTDLAVANFDSTVSVFINNGDGTFATKVDYTTGLISSSVAIGDISGDGKADLVVTNENSNTVSVFINNGDGTFA
ncbi:MAG: VCBS repeat-containing protein, partial [Candidatus Pacebacteria bacterium]|nr:VCBS repeat-containing protein [Candidatus Paceibacterota bacterium]